MSDDTKKYPGGFKPKRGAKADPRRYGATWEAREDDRGRTWHDVTFDSTRDAARYAAEAGAGASQTEDKPHFNLGAGLQKAKQLALSGWSGEALERMEEIGAKVERAAETKSAMPETYYALAGDEPDVGRFLSGEPRCMMAYRQGANDMLTEEGGGIVTVYVNLVASSSVPQDTLIERGATALALIDALESAGRRVEVYTCDAMQYRGRSRASINVRIKRPDEHVNLKRLAFWLAHPAALRSIGFGYRYAFVGDDGGTYGRCNERPAEFGRGDLYLPELDSRNPFTGSPEKCAGWLRERLEELGVELEDAEAAGAGSW